MCSKSATAWHWPPARVPAKVAPARTVVKGIKHSHLEVRLPPLPAVLARATNRFDPTAPPAATQAHALATLHDSIAAYLEHLSTSSGQIGSAQDTEGTGCRRCTASDVMQACWQVRP